MQGTLLKVSEEGTQFRSYYDGKKIDLTPESTVQATRPLQIACSMSCV